MICKCVILSLHLCERGLRTSPSLGSHVATRWFFTPLHKSRVYYNRFQSTSFIQHLTTLIYAHFPSYKDSFFAIAGGPPPRRNIEDGAARWDSLMAQSNKNKKNSKKRVIESDSEYDSEMDDFIDDGDGYEDDYSAALREITGYDRRK